MKNLWRSILVPLLTTILVACPSGPNPPGISNLQPSLPLTGKTGITTLADLSFKNSGGSDLSYVLSENADWLSITEGASATVKPNASATVKFSATCPTPKPTAPLSEKVKLTVTGFASLNTEVNVTLT
jgi:hypothetical protein